MPVLQELLELADKWDASLRHDRQQVGAYCFQLEEYEWEDMLDDGRILKYDVEFNTPSSKSATYVTAKLDEEVMALSDIENDVFAIAGVIDKELLYPWGAELKVSSIEELSEFTVRELRALLKAAKQILKEQYEVEVKVEAELKKIATWVEGYAVGKLQGHFSNGEAVFERLDGNDAALTGRYDALAQ